MEDEWARRGRLSALPLLRLLLTLGAAWNRSGVDYESLVEAAANSNTLGTIAATSARDSPISSDVADRVSADTAYVAYSAARAAVDTTLNAGASAYSAGATAQATSLGRFVSTDSGIWNAIRADVNALQSESDPLTNLLWPGPPPDWFTETDVRTRSIWSRAPETWSFWVRLWDGFLAGKPLDWELQRDVALIPDEDWEKGPTHIAALIADIELRYAIDRTPNAESVSINPLTGRLRVDSVSSLPSDYLADVLDRLRDAQSNFLGLNHGHNTYGTIASELRLVDDAIARYSARPRMIYTVCERVNRRITTKIEDGTCPAKDPLIEDLLAELRGVRSVLISFDDDVKAAVDAQNRLSEANLTNEELSIITEGAAKIAAAAEGDLAAEMLSDVAVLADPTASPKDKSEAFYTVASRAVRAAWVSTKKNVRSIYRGGRSTLAETAGIAKDVATVGAVFGLPTAWAKGWLDPLLKVLLDVLARTQ